MWGSSRAGTRLPPLHPVHAAFFLQAQSCSPGCDEMWLGNTICDSACNTTECIWDQGDCGYFGEFELEDLCAPGCPMSWIDDDYCDEACYNAACRWDVQDCSDAAFGCADGCLPSWIDDEECDAACNNEACGWDGTDCDHGVDDCYKEPNGADYRGALAVTEGGWTCQSWASQMPHPHTHTYINYPTAGLGGHNYCRNPGGERDAPWCYTLKPGPEMERCTVPQPSNECALKAPPNPYHYHTLCPVDCAPLLGNGLCEMRCNISSCAFDRGDCGVGLDLTLVLEGYTGASSLETISMLQGGSTIIYLLVGGGVTGGVLIGLLILHFVLRAKKKEEEKRRGYSEAEMKGLDNVHLAEASFRDGN